MRPNAALRRLREGETVLGMFAIDFHSTGLSRTAASAGASGRSPVWRQAAVKSDARRGSAWPSCAACRSQFAASSGCPARSA